MKKKSLIYLFGLALFFTACNASKGKEETSIQNPTQVATPKETFKKVQITTDFGVIKIKLYNETPKHRDNFVKLAEQKYYDGTLFHRVIPQFMIQGGDPDSKNAKPGQMLGNGGPPYRIPAEFNSNLFHKKGAVAAARDNNPLKESSGSQFYIVQGKVFTEAELDQISSRANIVFSPAQRAAYTTIGGAPHLDGSYTVFGEVYEGIEVVDKIAAVKTGAADRPVNDVKMTVTVIE